MIKGSVLLVVAVYSLTAAGSASGQTFTLSGGVVRAGSSESESTGTGLVIGGYFSAPLANRFSYELGFTYTQRFMDEFAFRTLNPDGSQSVTQVQTRHDYIEIPILLKANFRADARISPHLFFGPAVGFHVSCSNNQTVSVFDSSGLFLASSETELPCGSPSGVQLDARAGLGMDVEVSSGLRAVADVSYSLGLTTIYPDLAGKSRALIISVGVGFRVG